MNGLRSINRTGRSKVLARFISLLKAPSLLMSAQVQFSGGRIAALRYAFSRTRQLGLRKMCRLLYCHATGQPPGHDEAPRMLTAECPPAPIPLTESCWSRYDGMIKNLLHPGPHMSVKPASTIHIADRDIRRAAGKIAFEACANPVVSIIIPVHNQIKHTIECLSSIQQGNRCGLALEIIVADGGSTDETPAILEGVNGIRYQRREHKTEFVDNCNLASHLARGEYALFLNNDVQLVPGALDAMLKIFEKKPDAGAVGPKVIYPSGHLQEAGGRIRRDGSTEMIGLNDDPDRPVYKVMREVDYCSGVCLMLPLRLFKAVGGFSASYQPAYCEDVDLCMKVRASGYKIYYQPEAIAVHHLSASYGSVDQGAKLECTRRNQLKLRDTWHDTLENEAGVRLIAFYLPQYHPIPENDLWWGEGFTEWRNVTSATPVFDGHIQPRLPADLGFYDLRVPGVMSKQARMAKRFGIHGFCYYYYWFQGKRLLEMPLERMLATGEPDMPFCICWANENWTRRWDGQDHEILMHQQHRPDDDENVMRDMIRYMRDRRYIKIDGRPLLLVYRTSLFPDIARTANIWRKVCIQEGIGDICLAAVESFGDNAGAHPETYGFDFTVNFPPHGTPYKNSCQDLILHRDALVYRYRDMIDHHTGTRAGHLRRFPGVCPGWDNTPRRKKGSTIFADATPGEYQAWLEWAIVESKRWKRGDSRLVFINAWNEWAEGATLEPDQQHDTSFLEATRNALFNAHLK